MRMLHLFQWKLKDVIESLIPNVDYEVDEIGWYAKEEVELNEEDKMLAGELYNSRDKQLLNKLIRAKKL